jgi:hypothetical protein
MRATVIDMILTLFFFPQQLQLFGNYQYLLQDVAITLMVSLTSKCVSICEVPETLGKDMVGKLHL